MAGQIVADCWDAADVDHYLRLGLICSQHFKWNCLIEKIGARIDHRALVEDSVFRQWRILSADDSHLSLVAVLSNETNIETNTVLDVREFASTPYLKSVVKASTFSENGLLNPARILVEVNYVGGEGHSVWYQVVTFKGTSNSKLATQRWTR